MTAPMEEHKVIQVAMPDNLLPRLEVFMMTQGCEVVRTPHLDTEEERDAGVENYIVVPALPPQRVRFSGPL